MKVIDLLNKIANKDEVPKKIAIKNKVLIYNEGEILNLQDCYYMNDDENATWEIWDYRLNDKVELIENNKIEKLEEEYYHEEPALIDDMTHKINDMTHKINEIIDYLNKENK